MNNKWKWGLGIAITVIMLLVPLRAQIFLPDGRYRMMDHGWHMPIMYGGFDVMRFGMMLIMWLIMIAWVLFVAFGFSEEG